MTVDDRRALLAEFVGTALLLLVVVGSGVASTDDQSDAAQLFQHAIVIGGVLFALVAGLAPVSGAHFNPAVTVAETLLAPPGGRPDWGRAGRYAAVQVAGAVLGVVIANLLFDLPAVAVAAKVRTGTALVASEAVATLGLVLVIFTAAAGRFATSIPAVVGGYVAAMVFSTSSTALMNPAVTVSRMFSDTWTGVRPVDAPAFVAAQIGAALVAVALVRAIIGPGEAEPATPAGRPDDAPRAGIHH